MTKPQKNIVTRTAIFLVNKLWLLLATAIIFTAVVFTLLRVFLPQINYFKSDIEHWIESTYKVDVVVDEINAEWGANGPVFSLKNFKLNSNDGQLSLAKVESLSIQVNGIATLLSGSLVTEEISMSGANINFILDRKLGVRFDTLQEQNDSLQLPEVQETSQIMLTYLFNQKKLVMLDSKIVLETLSGRDFNYHLNYIEIENYEAIHQISGRLTDDYNGELKIVAEIFGDPSDDQSYTDFYLEGKDVSISQLPIYSAHPKLKPLSGKLNWRLWSGWRNGRWQNAIGDVQLTELAWPEKRQASTSKTESVANIEELNIERFNFDFKWQFNDEESGMLTWFNSELKKQSSEVLDLPNFHLLFDQPMEGDIRWQLLVQNFNFSPLAENLLNPLLNLVTEESQLLIDDLVLDLDSFGLRLFRKNNAWRQPTIYSNIKQLSYSRLADLPTINPVSAEYQLVKGLNQVKLSAKDTELDFNGLFRNKLEFSEMSVAAKWYIDEQQNFRFVSDSIYFSNPHLTLNAKAQFLFQDEKPILSLFAQVSDINATHKSLYLPTQIMSDGLVEYLDNSVVSGKLPLVKAVMHGPLESFPFGNTEGLFSILGMLEESTFRYLPDWPEAQDFSAKLLFEGNGMDLRALGGSAMGVEVSHARAVIRDYSAENTPFELYLDGNSRDNQGQKFLAASPLRDIAESISILNYEGEIRSKINLFFGLEDSSNLKVRGEITPQQQNSKLTITDFEVSDIDGSLLIDENGVKPSQFTAMYHGKPVQATLTGAEDETQAEVNIDVSGKLNSSAVADVVGEEWSQLVEGESDVTANIQVAPISDRSSTLINVTSDLKGILVKLPGELHKAAEEEQPLAVKVKISDNSFVQVEWQKFKGKWWWAQEEVIRQLGGEFYYGIEKEFSVTESSDYAAEIVFEELDIESWQFISDMTSDKSAYSSLEQHPDINLNVQIKKLITPLADLSQVAIQAEKKSEQNWRFSSQSSAGNLSLQMRENQPWKLEIESLDFALKKELLDEPTEQAIEEKMDSSDSGISKIDDLGFWDYPTNWPELSLHCGDCKVDKVYLGKINAELLHNQQGIEFKGNIRNKKHHNLNFNLSWSLEEVTSLNQDQNQEKDTAREKDAGQEIDVGQENSDDKDQNKTTGYRNLTKLDFNLTSDDMGTLLEQLEYPSAVKDSGANISGKLWWSQNPWSYDVLTIDGLANIDLGKGYISEVSDAKARLFSLLSLQSLSRRLQLDFSDVFKKGFHYDGLDGDVSLQNGVLSAHNLYVDGNAAKVTLSGQLDLKDNTMEQHALVLPQLTSSLPVLVGWAVEPTTGVIVYLLNKIFEPAIEVVTQIEYRIHGSLDDIQVDEVKRSKSEVKYQSEEDSDTQVEEEETNQEPEPSVIPAANEKLPEEVSSDSEQSINKADTKKSQTEKKDDNKVPFGR